MYALNLGSVMGGRWVSAMAPLAVKRLGGEICPSKITPTGGKLLGQKLQSWGKQSPMGLWWKQCDLSSPQCPYTLRDQTRWELPVSFLLIKVQRSQVGCAWHHWLNRGRNVLKCFFFVCMYIGLYTANDHNVKERYFLSLRAVYLSLMLHLR